MLLNYCTLFDFRYLSRGLALHKSLLKHTKDFQLYILAMDSTVEAFLKRQNIPFTTIIGLSEIETPELLEARKNRTWQEYCWTVTPAILKYCFERYKLSNCTYLDADIFFFADPRRLIENVPPDNVMITPHNYHRAYDHSATSGIYCVQFIKFSSAPKSKLVLNEWYSDCIKWCYARFEEGKFGDQKYLDTWPNKYDCISVCDNQGAGLAPWNSLNYELFLRGDTLEISQIDTLASTPLYFYHFHDFYFNAEGIWYHSSGISGYRIPKSVYDLVYKTYLRELRAIGLQYANLELLDIPSVPRTINEFDFECSLLGRIQSPEDRTFLRQVYTVREDTYHLSDLSAPVADKIFTLLLEADFNLSSNGYWHIPENAIYREIAQLRSLPAKHEDQSIWSLLRKLFRLIFR